MLNGELELSLERICKALVEFGLSESDSRVYIKIAVNGPMTAKGIIEELSKQRIIKITGVRPFVVSALAFEKVLQMLIDLKLDESKEILENKEELLSCWKAVNWNNGT